MKNYRSVLALVLTLLGIPTLTSGQTCSTLAFSAQPDKYPGVEGSVYTFTVIRVGDATSSASVAYFTSDITAKAGVHYVSTRGTLTFAPNQVQGFVSVPILKYPDSAQDAGTFQLVLTGPGTQAPATNAIAAINNASTCKANPSACGPYDYVDDPALTVFANLHEAPPEFMYMPPILSHHATRTIYITWTEPKDPCLGLGECTAQRPSFRFQLAKDPLFTNIIRDITTQGAGYVYGGDGSYPNSAEPGVYYGRVRATVSYCSKPLVNVGNPTCQTQVYTSPYYSGHNQTYVTDLVNDKD